MSARVKGDALLAGMSAGLRPATTPTRDRFSDAAIAAGDDVAAPGGQNRTQEPVAPTNATQASHSTTAVNGKLYTPGMEVEVGEKYSVPLKYVSDNPNNPREFYPREALQKLADSIRREGQLTPAQAYLPTPNNPTFVLKEGHSRKKALASIGRDTITLEVVAHAASPMEDYRQAREINKQRNDITVFDDASRFQKLLDMKVAQTQEELALALQESPEYVSKVINIGKMPALLLQKMADASEYRFGMTMAHYVRLFYELTDEPRAHKLVSKILDSRLSVRQVEQLLQTERVAAATGEERKERTVLRQRPLTRALFNGAGEGELKYFPDGRFELTLTVKDDNARRPVFNKVVDALKAVGVDVVSGVEA